MVTFRSLFVNLFKTLYLGSRPNQNSFWTGCEATIKGQIRNFAFTVKSINDNHNHAIGSNIYSLYSQQSKLTEALKKQILDASKLGAQSSSLAKHISDQTGRHIKTKKINNVIAAMNKETDIEALQYLDQTLAQVESEGGVVQIIRDGNKVLQSLFICTAEMKNDLLRFCPEVLILDTTYDTNSNLYKLLAVVYVCQRTGGTRIACLGLLVNETNATVDHIIKRFAQLYPKVTF